MIESNSTTSISSINTIIILQLTQSLKSVQSPKSKWCQHCFNSNKTCYIWELMNCIRIGVNNAWLVGHLGLQFIVENSSSLNLLHAVVAIQKCSHTSNSLYSTRS